MLGYWVGVVEMGYVVTDGVCLLKYWVGVVEIGYVMGGLLGYWAGVFEMGYVVTQGVCRASTLRLLRWCLLLLRVCV